MGPGAAHRLHPPLVGPAPEGPYQMVINRDKRAGSWRVLTDNVQCLVHLFHGEAYYYRH